MRKKLSSGADISGRWMSATLELHGLLEENDALLEQRASLRRTRAALFSAIVDEARIFVDGVNVTR